MVSLSTTLAPSTRRVAHGADEGKSSPAKAPIDTNVPEQIINLKDVSRRLTGAIVVNSTRRGPAAGGCRLYHYQDNDALLADAVRLAESMTYKNALADLPFGGGKAVIAIPQGAFDRSALFEAFGEAVEALEGRYVTAEDVNTTISDMEVVAGRTRHVAGRAVVEGSAGGDPSFWTAKGVFLCMQQLVETRFGMPLSDATVAVQGLGHVGLQLCTLLAEAGARLIVSDSCEPRVDRALKRFEATAMPIDQILTASADVFSPCAIGGVLNEHSVVTLKAKLVCGAANNQLADGYADQRLAEQGILYAPDYVVNAGGIISVAGEYLGWSEQVVTERVSLIAPRLRNILGTADDLGVSPVEAAKQLAKVILQH